MDSNLSIHLDWPKLGGGGVWKFQLLLTDKKSPNPGPQR